MAPSTSLNTRQQDFKAASYTALSKPGTTQTQLYDKKKRIYSKDIYRLLQQI